MTRTDRKLVIGIVVAALMCVALFFLTAPKAKGQPAPQPPAPIAVPCPPDAKSCKVIVVTPEQEALLVQMIENTGVTGSYAQIAQAVKFFTEMITKAPAGTVAPAKP